MRNPSRGFVVLRRAAILPALALLVVLASAPAPAAAQSGTLEGTVLDEENGDPLFAANVLVTSLRDPSTRYARLTSERGRFEVEGIPAGRYEVRASFIGYETAVIDAIEVVPGATARATIALAVQPIAMERVVVTASRRKEMVLDAPAAVHVIDGEEVRSKEVLTPADHLQTKPSVDVVRSGLTQSNVVVRGFNNVFSGATLMLVDNRIARVPSLRYNAWNLIPTANGDLERIEVVSGPGSALYGPNSANGVVHLITRSPFGSEGTTVSLGGGDQDIVTGSIRHAGSLDEEIGWKISAHWFRGEDFAFVDPVEAEDRLDALAQGAEADTLRIGKRLPDTEKISVEGRLDFRPNEDVRFIANGGINRIDSVELTGLGAVQADDYVTSYGQLRLNWRDFFVQTYLNRSDAQDTYNLRTGKLFVDQSTFFVTQAQHQAQIGERQVFTYGVDAMLTRPDTEGTINGRNEDDDDINEIGGYLQSDSRLSERWSIVGAARIDEHNHIEDPVFSPRAALVFGPAPAHKFRATYNRAYSTPTTNNLFLDLLTAADVGDFAALRGATEGAGFDLRAKGVPEGGFRFRRDGGGGIDGLYMQVPEALGGPGASLYSIENPSAVTSLGAHIPASARTMWPSAVDAVFAASGGLIDLRGTVGVPALWPSEDVGSRLMVLNPTVGAFEPISATEVQDVGAIRPTITNTFEIGYKGTIGGWLSATVDVHHDRIKDFVGPLRVETPNVFFDPDDPDFRTYLASVGVPTAQIPAVVAAFASVPLGTVTPEGNADPGDLILTYRNFGDVDLTGFDVGFDARVSRRWSVGGTYSYVSKDFFEDVEGDLDVALNAPAHKAGGTIRFADEDRGVSAGTRVRFVDGFPIESGVYNGEIGYYTLVDVDASWRLPSAANTVVSAAVLNVLDDEHPEFVGVPEIGRVGILRLTHTF